MMNLHFIRRGLSPHQNQQSTSNNSQQSNNNNKQTPNNNTSNLNNYSTNHFSLFSNSSRKRTLEECSMDLDDLPSPPSLFSSTSLIATMNASIMNNNTNEKLSQIEHHDEKQPSTPEDEIIEEHDDPNEQTEEEIIISQSTEQPILKTQFPPLSMMQSKENGLLEDNFDEDDEEYIEDFNDEDEDELKEFSIKQVEQSTKKRKLNIVNKEEERKVEQIVEDNPKSIILLTQLPPATNGIKQDDIVEEHVIDEEEFLNNATVPQENEMVKSLEDNVIEEFSFTPEEDHNIEDLSQIPNLDHNRQSEEDFDIHVDLHELDYEFSNNIELVQKSEEPTQPKKSVVDMSIQTDSSLLPKPVQIVNSDPNNICSICLSAWSSTGLHQVCCLSCGHLFGKNCIEKWLKKNSTCPKCKKSADRSHIRLLYVDNIHAIDTQKVEDLESKLEAEVKARKELELIKNGLELRIKMLLEQKGENFTENSSSSVTPNKGAQQRQNPELDTNKRKSLIQRSLELAERKKKEFELINSEEEEVTRNIVCYNGKSKNNQQSRKNNYLYGSNGANKFLFNTPLENSGLIEISNNQIFISFERKDKTCGFYVTGLERFMSNPNIINQTRKVMHNSPISDIKPLHLLSSNNSKGYSCDYMQSNLILTSSQDKSMRITDLRQGTADSICFCPYLSTNREGLATSITCCEWNRTNSNYCFAGLSSGSILCYDTRKPSEPYLNTGDHSCSPHTMYHIPNKGLVVGSNNSISYYDENQYGYTKGQSLFNKEISSLQFNTANGTLLFTSRESSKSSQLQIFSLESSQHVNCLENISINHKGPKLGKPYVSNNGQNYLSTIAVPKPDDFSVEIWKSQTDQDYSFKGEIKLQSSTEIIQSCALSFNNLFVVTKDNLSAYLV